MQFLEDKIFVLTKINLINSQIMPSPRERGVALWQIRWDNITYFGQKSKGTQMCLYERGSFHKQIQHTSKIYVCMAYGFYLNSLSLKHAPFSWSRISTLSSHHLSKSCVTYSQDAILPSSRQLLVSLITLSFQGMSHF